MIEQERVARALLQEMEKHGGIDEFVEKLLGFPEKYCSALALAAIREIKNNSCTD